MRKLFNNPYTDQRLYRLCEICKQVSKLIMFSICMHQLSIQTTHSPNIAMICLTSYSIVHGTLTLPSKIWIRLKNQIPHNTRNPLSYRSLDTLQKCSGFCFHISLRTIEICTCPHHFNFIISECRDLWPGLPFAQLSEFSFILPKQFWSI